LGEQKRKGGTCVSTQVLISKKRDKKKFSSTKSRVVIVINEGKSSDGGF